MSLKKQQKERDKAVQHLFDYIEASETWSPRVEDLTNQFMRPVMQNLGMSATEVQGRLLQSPYGPMVYGFLMEMMSVTCWNAETVTPIDEYLKKRGWREGPHGRRYLNALNESELHFLQVSAVKPGKWVEVRPFGTNVVPERVLELNGSERLHIHDAIVARLVKLGTSCKFGSILPLSHAGAQHLKAHVDDVEDYLKDLYEEAVAEDGAEGLVKDFADGIVEERKTRIEETGFMCFACDVLGDSSAAPPQLFNTDDERIVMTKTRFPIVGDPRKISDCLDVSEHLVDDSEVHWSWLKSDGSSKVLGTIELTATDLVLETNSVERSENGIVFLQSCLPEGLIGSPLSVHDNIDHTLSRPPAPKAHASIDVAQHPELQGAVQEALKASYRSSLDQPIPMLGDESPRACASDPEKRHKAVGWIQYLENMESKSAATPHDFTWLWDELGLTDYR